MVEDKNIILVEALTRIIAGEENFRNQMGEIAECAKTNNPWKTTKTMPEQIAQEALDKYRKE